MITEVQLKFRFNPKPYVTSTVLQREFHVERLEAGCSQLIADHMESHDVEHRVNKIDDTLNNRGHQSHIPETSMQINTPLPSLPVRPLSLLPPLTGIETTLSNDNEFLQTSM